MYVRVSRLKCDEAPEEPSTVSTEKVLKIECNISITTNFMLSGIMDVRSASLLFFLFLFMLNESHRRPDFRPLMGRSRRTHFH